jgi:hypothetical protein
MHIYNIKSILFTTSLFSIPNVIYDLPMVRVPVEAMISLTKNPAISY